jgi:hypothetical protein
MRFVGGEEARILLEFGAARIPVGILTPFIICSKGVMSIRFLGFSHILPYPLEYEAEKHHRSVLMIGTALRKRSGVFYGENRLSLQSRLGPGQRGMNQWRVYQVPLPKQKKTS